MIEVNRENGIVRKGNRYRLRRLIERAKRGEKLTIGFIGGSITQGSLATVPDKCYAYHVYDWWVKSFPQAEFVYLNAGIGATTSQFACARAEEDLLKYRPDFVIIEFSVNDESNLHYLETYEGLVRKVFSSESEPAVLLVHNVFYDTGANAQLQHGKIGRYYDLPCVSMQSSIYPELLSGKIENRTITPDDLHPNDEGHELVASVITYFLEKTVKEADMIEDKEPSMPESLTVNSYENSKRYYNRNYEPECEGFAKDTSSQRDITDCFKNGWMAEKQGSRITFSVEGTGVSIQYCKSVTKPAPIATVVIDDDTEHTWKLDANFQETWGNKLELETLTEHMKPGKHKVEITLTEVEENNAVPFYLASVIMAD